jgi:3-phenylpropionate/trans-cinnamate dioxygenase ferredoxin component
MAYVPVAKVSDVAPGTVKYVGVGPEEIALCNVDGEFYAIADVCTHDGGSLDQGSLDGYQIECPRHGARFDVRTGAVRALPAILPIPTFDVRVEGDTILVDVD